MAVERVAGVKFRATTDSTDDFGIGAPAASFRLPVDASLTDGAEVDYIAFTGNERAAGRGTYDSGTQTISRDSEIVIAGSEVGGKCDFGSLPTVAFGPLPESFGPLAWGEGWEIGDVGILRPVTDAVGTLGDATHRIDGIYLAANSGLDWDNGDVAFTHQDSGDANLTLAKSMLLDFGAVTSGFTGLTIRQADTGSNSPRLTFFQDSSSPAAADQLGQLVSYGRDSANNVQLYGKLGYRIDDPTSGSEDSAFFVNIFKAGASFNSLYIDSAGVNISDYTNCANTVTINPPTQSTAYAYGLHITQAGRGTSSSYIEEPDVQYEHYWNRIEVNASGEKVQYNPAAGTGTDVAFCVRMGVGSAGGTSEGQKVAVEGLVNLNNITNDTLLSGNWCGGSFVSQTSPDITIGSDTDDGAIGYVFGANLIGTLGERCLNYYTVTSSELLSGMMDGSSCRYHVGVRIVQWFNHAENPSELSAGIQLINQSGSIGWRDYGLVFDANSAGFGTMLQSSGTFIGSLGAQSLSYGVDFSSASFSQHAWNSYGAQITGGGGIHGRNIGFVNTDGSYATATQSTNKTTTVTCTGSSGQITLASGNIVSGAHVTFQVTSSSSWFVSTRGDVVIAKHVSGGTSGAYEVSVSHAGVNSFNLIVENVSGSDKNEQPVIAFAIIRGGNI